MPDERPQHQTTDVGAITRRMTTRWIVLTLTLLGAPFAFMAWDPSAVLNSVEWSGFVVSGWVLLVAVGILTILLLNRADRARLRELARTLRARRLEICRRCGYNLSGTRADGLCPECGLEFQRFAGEARSAARAGESPSRGGANQPPG